MNPGGSLSNHDQSSLCNLPLSCALLSGLHRSISSSSQFRMGGVNCQLVMFDICWHWGFQEKPLTDFNSWLKAIQDAAADSRVESLTDMVIVDLFDEPQRETC